MLNLSRTISTPTSSTLPYPRLHLTSSSPDSIKLSCQLYRGHWEQEESASVDIAVLPTPAFLVHARKTLTTEVVFIPVKSMHTTDSMLFQGTEVAHCPPSSPWFLQHILIWSRTCSYHTLDKISSVTKSNSRITCPEKTVAWWICLLVSPSNASTQTCAMVSGLMTNSSWVSPDVWDSSRVSPDVLGSWDRGI